MSKESWINEELVKIKKVWVDQGGASWKAEGKTVEEIKEMLKRLGEEVCVECRRRILL